MTANTVEIVTLVLVIVLVLLSVFPYVGRR